MIKSFLKLFSSLKLAVVCLSLLFILVLVTTFAQRYFGIYYAVSLFMTSWVITVTVPGFLNTNVFPLFPGGMLVSTILLINLIVTHFTRFKFSYQKLGIWLTHFSVILLIVGAAITHFTARESLLSLKEGESKAYSEHARFVELAIVDVQANQAKDILYSISEKSLKNMSVIQIKDLPFYIKIKKLYQNSELSMQNTAINPEITQGVGSIVKIKPLRVETRDNFRNTVTVIAEIFTLNHETLGTWLFSNGLNGPQELSLDNKRYLITIRPERFYEDYLITLHDFKFDRYLGTETPKNFESIVSLTHLNTQEKQDISISMNKPFRYQQTTYYQASFGEKETMTILQVVKNKAWTLPYISCILLAIGLSMQFLISLIVYLKKKRSKNA
eukprot:COSAG01_NODE_740_length_13891_cov_35.573013_14_plen_386_part_00